MREFPGGPVVRTQRFHCCGPGFNLWSGTKIPQDIQCSQKKKKRGRKQQIYEWDKLGLKKKYCDNIGTFYYRNK